MGSVNNAQNGFKSDVKLMRMKPMTNRDTKDYCKNCDVEPPAMKIKCPECEHNPDKEQIKDSLKNHSQNFSENSTQEKEQIIIDGIQFNKFGDFYVDYDFNSKFQSISSSSKEYKILKSLIEQLARKTQECEQKGKELLSNEKIINKLMKEVDELKQECEELKSKNSILKNSLKPFQDEYFKNLETIVIASLAKKSIRITAENTQLRKALEVIEGMLQVIVESNKVYPLQSNLYKILDIISKAKGEEWK